MNASRTTVNAMARVSLMLFVAGLGTVALASQASAHCQVPCGIYDDTARFDAMTEDATTIKKAMASIGELAGKTDALSQNQLARWVQTKEEHASRVITTVSEYFLTQKLKPVDKSDAGYQAYLQQLADHHAVLRAAMKCKQTVDTKNAEALDAAIQALMKHYGAHAH